MRKDLEFVIIWIRLKWFDILSFGKGPNIFSISLSFFCTKAAHDPHHTI